MDICNFCSKEIEGSAKTFARCKFHRKCLRLFKKQARKQAGITHNEK